MSHTFDEVLCPSIGFELSLASPQLSLGCLLLSCLPLVPIFT